MLEKHGVRRSKHHTTKSSSSVIAKSSYLTSSNEDLAFISEAGEKLCNHDIPLENSQMQLLCLQPVQHRVCGIGDDSVTCNDKKWLKLV